MSKNNQSKENNTYSIRQESLITPWGIGAIVPFPHDESLMVAGLDYWFNGGEEIDDSFIIEDQRLSKLLGGKIFVEPPDFRKKEQDPKHFGMTIPAVRFPLWHYCPVCGNMAKIGTAGQKPHCPGDIRKENKKETYCFKYRNKPNRLPLLIPERFVAVCPKGHIEDFPIEEWIHKKSNMPYNEVSCRIYRSTGGSDASLSGVRYTCTCGATATMARAFGKDALLNEIGYTCHGNRPWLGSDQNVGCGESLLVLQRGASNVWFADIISSVYIPVVEQKKNKETKGCIDAGLQILSSSLKDGKVDIDLIRRFISSRKLYEPQINEAQAFEEIYKKLCDIKDDAPQTEDEFRKQEYDVLITTAGDTDSELYVVNYSRENYNNIIFLDSISLVHKLRETRVFQGFRRINPEAEVLAEISVEEKNWLPAIKNSGEGIMFQFNCESLLAWTNQGKVVKRTKIIEENLKKAGKLQNQRINPIYVLLHTFAHCLITALSSESGYSNASIRERIYCPKYISEDNPQMTGVLIYTASGDAEGSLGGLVRQGMPGRIENIISRAINEAKWCAADPVCIQSPGQGQYGCNLAACHNCALLPETSCENKNMLLDRGLMIGTLDDSSIGFFNDYE